MTDFNIDANGVYYYEGQGKLPNDETREKVEVVKIASWVTRIEEKAFYNCKNLKKIIWNNKVTSIGYRAFCNCESLESFVMPSSVNTIDREVCSYCSNLHYVYINNKVKEIPMYAFSSCPLDKVIIGNNVTYIADRAFFGGSKDGETTSNLKEVVIPASVQTIGEGAFRGNRIEKVYLLNPAITLLGTPGSYNPKNGIATASTKPFAKNARIIQIYAPGTLSNQTLQGLDKNCKINMISMDTASEIARKNNKLLDVKVFED